MDLETLRYLRSPRGSMLLARAAALPAGEQPERSFLTRLSRLRREFADAPGAAPAAALEQVELTGRLQEKFPGFSDLLVTREGLEQATGRPVAQYQANRLVAAVTQGGPVVIADLTSGIGGDTLALAAAVAAHGGGTVLAFDRDPLKVALTALNAAAAGFRPFLPDPQLAELLPERLPESTVTVEARVADANGLVAAEPGGGEQLLRARNVAALYLDPSRRVAGRRVFDPHQYQPAVTVEMLAALSRITPAIAVKLAPGLDYETWQPAGQNELEFISYRGELKEAILWHGPLRTCLRRAMLLPAHETLCEDAPDAPQVPVAGPQGWLYEPDPAVIRAHLVEPLARILGAHKLDPDIAYLSTPHYHPTSFADAYRVIEWMPFNLKQLNTRLRAFGTGQVVIKKRGSPLDPQQLEKMLRLTAGSTVPLTLILTTVEGRHSVLLCEPVSLPQ